MKKIPQAEETQDSAYSFFDDTDFGPITTFPEGADAVLARSREHYVLDRFLAAIKWIFLFVPGAAAIHMILLGFGLLLLYSDWSSPMMIGSAGIVAVASFMVMLGVGKLGDLKYLRVVGSIVAVSTLAASVYPIMASFIPGDFFGLYARCTFFITLLAGYLVKRHTDKI